jgi:hypothetical protein
MNRMSLAMSVGLVAGLATALSAQTASSNYGKVDQKIIQSITVKVTGCIAAGSESGHYILTDAVISGDDVTSTAGTAGKEGSEKDVSIEHGPSYDLEGGYPKAHLGHKVEVTGIRGDAKLSSRDPLRSAIGSAKYQKETLTVKSVKMISALCP